MSFRPIRDVITACLSGFLLAASFPLLDWSYVAWVALVPLFLVVSRRPFLCGYAAGLGFFAATLYWLNIVMVTYGQLPLPMSIVAYLMLVSYLALYFAIPIWLADRFRTRIGLSMTLTLPLLWISFEFLRGFVLTGFPWALVGYSQHAQLPLIQSADLIGVYGIGALIIYANLLVADVFRTIMQRDLSLFPKNALTVFVFLLALNLGYGYWSLNRAHDQIDTPVAVGLIQGNIDQSIKWNPDQQKATIQSYISLSDEAIRNGARLLIWPESATPFYLQDSSPLSRTVQLFVARTGRQLLTGSPAYDYGVDGIRYLNSAFLVSPEGNLVARSDKVHLVPFGEYVPLKSLLPFINKLVVGIGDFTPGSIKPINSPDGKMGILVCYEGIFPELARQYVKAGSGLLINVTNDAWFGRSSAPYQHLAMARFRAIENRRWLVRSANTGISAVIAPSGEVVSASPVFEPAVIVDDVAFRSEKSVYTIAGDVFPLVSLALVLFWLVRSRRKLSASNIN